MEVRQLWEYGENIEVQLNASAHGDADWLDATGNVLITFGWINFVGGVSSASLGLGTTHARIVEATDDLVPERVFELLLYDPEGGEIHVYRSQRIPSLYPLQDGAVRYVRSPNGVGDTLRMSKTPGSIPLEWTASPVDSHHDAADYYIVYGSSSPDGGFAMLDSTAHTNVTSSSGTETEF